MHDLSNLDWPEAPFGANQRPFGKQAPTAAGFAFEWPDSEAGGGGLVGAATVYLRVARVRADLTPAEYLPFGYRCLLAEESDDVPRLLELTDRALLRARRHAVLLSGASLGGQFDRLMAQSETRLPGTQGVEAAWRDRARKGRGLATMFDTDLDLTSADRRPSCSKGHAPGQLLIERALTTVVEASLALKLVTLSGDVNPHSLVEAAAWDQLSRLAPEHP